MTNIYQYNPYTRSPSSKLSFLKSRGYLRNSGVKIFQENKIRSCSYVKETRYGVQAIPFYDRRPENLTLPSLVKSSLNAEVHAGRGTILHAGMGTLKPLEAYSPNKSRNLLLMADFRAGHRNRSTLQLGDRTTPNKNNFVTIYGQSFKAKINNLPTNNQGIVAYYKKWERVQLQH